MRQAHRVGVEQVGPGAVAGRLAALAPLLDEASGAEGADRGQFVEQVVAVPFEFVDVGMRHGVDLLSILHLQKYRQVAYAFMFPQTQQV